MAALQAARERHGVLGREGMRGEYQARERLGLLHGELSARRQRAADLGGAWA